MGSGYFSAQRQLDDRPLIMRLPEKCIQRIMKYCGDYARYSLLIALNATPTAAQNHYDYSLEFLTDAMSAYDYCAITAAYGAWTRASQRKQRTMYFAQKPRDLHPCPYWFTTRAIEREMQDPRIWQWLYDHQLLDLAPGLLGKLISANLRDAAIYLLRQHIIRSDVTAISLIIARKESRLLMAVPLDAWYYCNTPHVTSNLILLPKKTRCDAALSVEIARFLEKLGYNVPRDALWQLLCDKFANNLRWMLTSHRNYDILADDVKRASHEIPMEHRPLGPNTMRIIEQCGKILTWRELI